MNNPPRSSSRVSPLAWVALLAAASVAVVIAQQPAAPAPAGAGARAGGAQPVPVNVPWNDAIPAGTDDHAARALKESPRHGEWVDIKMKDGTNLHSWVMYPAATTKVGVVVVIHDIFGMRDMPRAVGDQIAQDGFISITPDFTSGKVPANSPAAAPGGRAGMNPIISALTADEVNSRLDAAMAYGKSLASSNGKTAVIGFCWGGTQSFAYAAAQPNLNAAIVYYGSAPQTSQTQPDDVVSKALANVKAPVIGFYAGTDNRIGATVPQTEKVMKSLGKSYETHTYEGAAHGFMGAQAGNNGANLKAAEQSWPVAVAFLKKNLQ